MVFKCWGCSPTVLLQDSKIDEIKGDVDDREEIAAVGHGEQGEEEEGLEQR